MPMILLHAIGLDAGSWTFTEVPGGQPLDLPGFGEQPLPAEGLNLKAMAEDVLARAPEGRLDVVGVSMGSQVAMLIGLNHPERVRSLVLANSGPAAEPSMMKQRAADTRAGGIESQIDLTIQRWFTETAIETNHPAVEYARDRLRRDSTEAFAAGWEAISGHNAKPRLAELKVPVTVIAGDADKAGPVEVVRQVHEAIRGSRFTVLKGPHILYMEFPDSFRAALQEHLAWVEKS